MAESSCSAVERQARLRSRKFISPRRNVGTYMSGTQGNNQSSLLYGGAFLMSVLALTYAAVPLYRVVCQQTGYGGTPMTDSSRFTAEHMIPVTSRKRIRVTFASTVSDALQWKFKPQQSELSVAAGETALAFYTAKNQTDDDIIGIATYNVSPPQVAPYFNKIQCFCFEEQKLAAGEEVDMPVFFFLDSDFASDPLMKNIDSVVLSYTFFKARYNKEGLLVPTVG